MAFVSEMGVGATRVMGRYENPSLIRVRLQDVEDGLRGQALRTNPSPFVERPKHAASPQAYCIGPPPDRDIHPVGNRNGADTAVFANQIGDDPTLFALLKMFEREGRGLAAAHPRSEEHR